MTFQVDRGYFCDRCGFTLTNGGVQECAAVASLTEDGAVRQLHFGRECGCEAKVLSKRNLAYLMEQTE